jgi:putative sterol carrier protein
MSEPAQTLPDFLRTAIAVPFRDMVNQAEQRLEKASREVDDLRTARGSIAWEIGADPGSRWFVNIGGGDTTVAATPAEDPFMIVALSETDWKRFVAGFAAGIFVGNERPFGRARIDRVRGVRGSIRFILTGLPEGGDFTVNLHFGNERSAEPKATVVMPVDVASKIQTGILNPQAAFMQGQMKLTGDMSFAMQLGLAFAL